MAQLISGNQIKKNDGSIVYANNGDWIDGQRFLDGKLLGVNEYEPGKFVGQETRAQSAAAQGVSLTEFDSFLNKQGQINATNIQAPVNMSLPSSSATGSNLGGLNEDVLKAKKALEDKLAKDKAENDAKLVDLRKREGEAMTEVKKLTTPFREDIENTERERLYVNKNFEENQKLVDELDQLLTEGNNLIKQQQEVTGLAAIRNPRIQKTMEDVSARAGVIQAVMSARNGQIQQAFTMIDRTIGAITQDRNDQLTYYETVLNLINRDIISIDADQKTIAQEQINILKTDLSRSQATVDLVKQYMLDPAKAQLMGQAGVSLNDSVESINLKLTNTQYSNEIRDQNNEISLKGGVAVLDPSTVPADQLVSYTDSRGISHYYKMPKAKDSVEGSTAESYLDTLKNSKVVETNNKSTLTPQKPQFTPAGGIGSVWVDPSTGTIWQYKSSGWVKVL